MDYIIRKQRNIRVNEYYKGAKVTQPLERSERRT